ncbi:PGR5-like protein 1B, chloroplastic [Impatiens glandulifera]|uniref:PGR5-like protein 1B, chloroplastic n=1 Tax=Impatiens glandulifera TaxID=253017 RepID=UPI001FB0D78A|nr:PGR5-like protein 1B, chloroplastic [Impatiens glandulifera]
MASVSGNSISLNTFGKTSVEHSRTNRTGPSLFVRISFFSSSSSYGNASIARHGRPSPPHASLAAEGPSCVFVGPIETASQETLEALYCQAQDAYYSGNPLIVDDMFDRVELKLRWYGSKHVIKYPRCSLRRQSAYADAEEDPSQVFTLASVWLLFLAVGSSACLVPVMYTIFQAYQSMFDPGFSYSSHASMLGSRAVLIHILFMALGSLIGYPIASASVGILRRLWRNDLIALKGACPSCGEEVFAFVKFSQTNNSPHRAACHVCESSLEYLAKVEPSVSTLGRRWVYGRIYFIQQRGKSQQRN